jgi:hypothetical protein
MATLTTKETQYVNVAESSGLDAVRYDADSLHDQFGVRLQLEESFKELHRTPFATTQQFLYCYCKTV